MGEHSCLGSYVDCYCVDTVVLGAHATVSQYSFLCTASRQYDGPSLELVTAPIQIGDHCWIAADVFIGPGVSVGHRSVVGARSTVLKDVPAGVVVAGTPAKTIRQRKHDA
jgi:putative colanic acid biosynthesis acetyltransferase WcaF